MQSDIWLKARFADIRPKALAALTRQFRDVDFAEEVFSSSCLKALQVWPEKGLPDDPFAWLLTVARNTGLDLVRRRTRERGHIADTVAQSAEAKYEQPFDVADLRDDVLRLLFICCHPDLTAKDQSALALRVVAGFDVSAIADAFLVSPKAMEQRLTRAKRVVAAADVPFETPALSERYKRVKVVSLMLYLMFGLGWSAGSGDARGVRALCEESIRLARLLLGLFPGVSELMGLLALFLLQYARRHARIGPDRNLVSLDDQDRDLWDWQMIEEAKVLLEKALRHHAPGPYQIKAAIAAVHADASRGAETDWVEIERLYVALYQFEPTPIVRLNHAAAVAVVRGPKAALVMLDEIEDQLVSYRWFYTTRAALLSDIKDYGGAKAAYERAILLAPTLLERGYIEQKIIECEKKPEAMSD